MQRLALRFGASVVIVLTLVVGANLHTASTAAAGETSHFVITTPADASNIESAFLQYKVRHGEMLTTDRVAWGEVNAPHGLNKVDIAYDAVDHRYWAIAAFDLLHPASLKAEISFQDGGNFGVFNKIGSGKWFMIWSPAIPLCPANFPAIVARFWGRRIFAACA
jgi:hypothetical protein